MPSSHCLTDLTSCDTCIFTCTPNQPRSPHQSSQHQHHFHLNLLCRHASQPQKPILDAIPRIYWSHSLNFGHSDPSILITTGTTVAFSFHVFSISSLSPCYFSGILFLFPDVAIATSYHYSLPPLLGPNYWLVSLGTSRPYSATVFLHAMPSTSL